jgi:hypothetical protein
MVKKNTSHDGTMTTAKSRAHRLASENVTLQHRCMYRVDNIPLQTRSVHLSLYYVMAISRQVIRVL